MRHRFIVFSLVVVVVQELGAQSDPVQTYPPEALALRTCVAQADSGKAKEAETTGTTAASLYRKRVASAPRDVEAIVGLARALSQCLVPNAAFMQQGELSHEALELLDRAIAIQPTHWLARFVIASISYRSPAFLGRGERAAREFDELLRMQGDRADNPMFARVFVLRGLQLNRGGRPDSAAVLWRRGAALFPNDEELKALARRTDSPQQPPAAATDATALATVQVTATTAPPRPPLPSVKEVSRSQVLMTAGGAADVLQSVQMQPGATRVTEGGDIYTRGGDASETSLLVNGGRLLSLARFEGLNGSMFGAIEPFIVKSVRFSSGGFSARHGNALSGVLEIETDGRPRERQTRAGMSLVQASGTLRAPVGKASGGWINGRISHTGALLQTHGRRGEFDGAPHSQEVIGSFIVAPTPFTEVRATGIVERDESRRYVTAAGWRGSFESQGDVRALALSSRWMSQRAPLVVRANLTGSSRSNDWSFGVLSRERDERSMGTRVDAEWQYSESVMLRAGTEQGTQLRGDRGAVPTTHSVATGSPVRALHDETAGANQIGGYVESQLGSGRLSFITGARVDRLPGETQATFDPRATLSVRLGEWTTRVSGGVFHQGRWRGDGAIPDASTPAGLPLRANHLVLGLEREGPSGLVRAEAYAKSYGEYRAFGAGPQIAGASARGVDLIAQRVVGRTTGWLGYSFLGATSELADGRRMRSTFDVTHSGTGSVTTTVARDWTLGTTLRYGSGRPTYSAAGVELLPQYARLDARLMRYVHLPSVLLTTYLEVINAGNRANVASYAYDAATSSREAVHTFFSQRTLVMGGELMFR